MKLNELKICFSKTDIRNIFELASSRAQLLSSSAHLPFVHTGLFEDVTLEEAAYFSLWENEVLPLMESFLSYIAEADLSPEQIQKLFGKAVAQAQASDTNKTAYGKTVDKGTAAYDRAAKTGKKIAGITVDAAKIGKDAFVKALKMQEQLKSKIGTLLQNSKQVQNWGARYENAVKKLEAALGGPDGKVSKITKQIGQWLKDHPIYAGGIVAVLALIATVVPTIGSIVAGISKLAFADYFLRFTIELLKGEKLSTAGAAGFAGSKKQAAESLNEVDWKGLGTTIKNIGQNVVRGAKGQTARDTSGKYIKPDLATKVGQQAAKFSSAVKQGAAKAGEKIAQLSHEYEHEVTLKKLQTAWEKAGKPTSPDQIAKILSYQGFDNDAIKSIFADSGLEEPQLEKPIGWANNIKADIDNVLSADSSTPDANKILADLKPEIEQLMQTGTKEELIKYLQDKIAGLEAKSSAVASPKLDQPAASNSEERPVSFKNQMSAAQPTSPISPKKNQQISTARLGMQAITPKSKASQPKIKSQSSQSLSPAAIALRRRRVSENIDTAISLARQTLYQLREGLLNKNDIKNTISQLFEFASSGSTGAGSIASYAGAGGPMMPVIRRMPAGQSFFGPAGTAQSAKPKKKRQKRQKKSI